MRCDTLFSPGTAPRAAAKFPLWGTPSTKVKGSTVGGQATVHPKKLFVSKPPFTTRLPKGHCCAEAVAGIMAHTIIIPIEATHSFKNVPLQHLLFIRFSLPFWNFRAHLFCLNNSFESLIDLRGK